jgi:hypothetical protein
VAAANLDTTILSYQSATQVTLAANASTSVTTANYIYPAVGNVNQMAKITGTPPGFGSITAANRGALRFINTTDGLTNLSASPWSFETSTRPMHGARGLPAVRRGRRHARQPRRHGLLVRRAEVGNHQVPGAQQRFSCCWWCGTHDDRYWWVPVRPVRCGHPDRRADNAVCDGPDPGRHDRLEAVGLHRRRMEVGDAGMSEIPVPDVAVTAVGRLYLQLTIAQQRIAELEQQLEDALPKPGEKP